MSDAARVFAYGSLMRGLKYSALLSDAVFCGAAETRDPYGLYDLGPYPAASLVGKRCCRVRCTSWMKRPWSGSTCSKATPTSIGVESAPWGTEHRPGSTRS